MGCFESCYISSSSVVFPCLVLPNLCCFFQGVSCLIYIPLASLAGHTLIPSFFSQCYQKYRSSVELGTVQVKNKIPGLWPKSHFLRPHTSLQSAIVAAMARRSNILAGAVLLAGLAALNSVSFVNPQPVERSSRMAMKGSAVEWVPKLSRDVVEVMFTAPAQGARSRMLIRADADVSEVIKQGRKKLGFDQDWMPDSDFKLYNAEDEDTGPLKGKMSENGLIDFSYEIHLYYEPQ